jgi:hypothetical protein
VKLKPSRFKILTENSKTPLTRALALASFLSTDYPTALGARSAPPTKDHMAFGTVLAHNQHNIGKQRSISDESEENILKKNCKNCDGDFLIIFLFAFHIFKKLLTFYNATAVLR